MNSKRAHMILTKRSTVKLQKCIEIFGFPEAFFSNTKMKNDKHENYTGVRLDRATDLYTNM